MSIQTADALMSIFGFKRVASIKGNVLEPVFEVECDICGDSHMSDAIPFTCENGDGE